MNESPSVVQRSLQSAADAIPIVFAIDDGYVRQVITAVHSIARNTRSQIEVHVASTILSDEARRVLQHEMDKSVAAVHFHPVASEWLAHFPDSPHYSKATFLRLRLPALLSELSKCIYLDPDILVRHDIAELWNWPLQEHPIAAVKDISVDWIKKHHKHINLPLGHTYFNAGVLVLDLAKLREMALESAAIRFASDEPERIEIVDQDILNILLANNVSYIPLKWNYCPFWTHQEVTGSFAWRNVQTYYDRIEQEEAATDPALVHFANVIKPWHASLEAIEHPFYEEYLRCDQEAQSLLYSERKPNADKSYLCVVVPFASNETTISPLLRSLSEQTYSCFEVILADYGCKDRSRRIAVDYQQWDHRFRVVPSVSTSKKKAVRAGARQGTARSLVIIEPERGWLPADYLCDLFSTKGGETPAAGCGTTPNVNAVSRVWRYPLALADAVSKYQRAFGSCPESGVVYNRKILTF
jgi:lipopolysaccharide biosynthesis glycosyltransferase